MMQYDVMVMNFCLESNLFQEDLMDKSYPNRDISAIPLRFYRPSPRPRPPALAVKGLASAQLQDNELNVLDIPLVDEIPNNHLGWLKIKTL